MGNLQRHSSLFNRPNPQAKIVGHHYMRAQNLANGAEKHAWLMSLKSWLTNTCASTQHYAALSLCYCSVLPDLHNFISCPATQEVRKLPY
jgi:hypothetical protein